MRRTLICLAITALALGGVAWAQPPLPMGQPGMMTGQPGTLANAAVPTSMQQGDLVPQPDPMAGAAENVWNQPPRQPAAMAGLMGDGEALGPCCERTGEGFCCPKNWYFDQGVRVLHHPAPLGVPIGRRGAIVDLAFTGTDFIQGFRKATAMSTRAARFEPGSGYEATIGHYLGRDADNCDRFIEFTFYGLHSWHANATIVADQEAEAYNLGGSAVSLWPNSDLLNVGETLTSGNLFSAFNNNVGGFNRADRQDIDYKSKWDNFELNLRFAPRGRRDRLILEPNGRWRREAQDNCRVTWLGGLRVISLDEAFRFTSSGHQVYRSGSTIIREYDVSGLYDVRTHNDLFGLQVGGEFTKRAGLATFGMRAKAAAFINVADQFGRISTTGADDDPLSTVGDFNVDGVGHSNQAAGLAEFGLLASYQMHKNVHLHAAYDLMWLGGLALAPEQIVAQPAAPTRVDSGGVLFFQSVSLGLELVW